ncbi:MAG: hypothetical protein WD907_03560 [Bacilli bacterium]
MNNSKQFLNQKGASLVELISTVAIVGVLAGVSTPIVINQIAEAEAKTDMYNMRIIADSIRYAVLSNNPLEVIGLSEGKVEDVKLYIGSKNESSESTISIFELLETVPRKSFIIQKEVPIDKPYEVIRVNQPYYITLP